MSWLSDLLTGNSSDKRAAERAKKTQEEQKANLLRVSKQAIQTGTPQQQQKAQRILTNKSWTVDSSYKPAYNNDPLKNATGTVGLGLYRSAIGTGQGLSGIYDLATPGKGTNRLSKALDVKAKRADEIAVQQNRSGLGYKGGQFLGDALTFTSGAPVIKGASAVLGTGAKMIPGASKVIAPTTNLVSKVSKPLTAVSTPVSKGIATTTAKLANKGAGGRIAAQAIQTGVSKSQLMNTGVDMGLGLGQMASKGQDIGWKDVALQGGISAGFGVGLPATAQAVKEVIQPTTKLVTGMARGVQNIDNSFNQKGSVRNPLVNPDGTPKIGKAPKTEGVVPDPLKVAEKRTNKGLKELSDIRKQYANDQEFFDKVILENQDAKGEIGDFARHIARRDATEGSIYNKNYLTEILDDELAPLNSKLDQSIAKTAQRDELAKTVRDFEKSTGQKGLYKKVAQAMQGMNEREQIDFMGKALKDMRDNGLMAADYLNKQNGYTPKTPPVGKTAPKTEGVAPIQKLKQEMATLNEELQKVKSQLDTATSEAEVMRLYDRKDAINTRLRQIVDTDVPLAEMQNSGVKNASEKMRIKNIDEQIQRGVNESDTRRLLDEKQAITEKLDAEILAQETKTRNAAHQKYVKETNAKFDNDLRKLKEIAPNKELTPQSKKLFDDLEKQWKDLPEKRGDSFTGYIMEQYGKAQPTPPKPLAPKTPPVGKTAPKTEGVVPTGKTYIVPKTNSTDVTKLTDKDLQYFGKQGYTAITDRFGNTRQIAPVATDGVKKLDNLNPTGGVYVDYDPKARATMPLADNITTLDKTAGKSPDELVTIYRGAPSNQKSINAGDFITTNKELAKSYTGDGNVLEMKVPASHILDDLDSPLGEEYLYRPTTKPLPPKTPPVAKTTPTISKTETVAPVEKTSPFEKALPQASDQKINGLSKTQPQQSPEISSPAQKIESQATQGQEIKVAEPFPASRTSNQKAASSYSNNTPIVNNKMDKKAYQEVFGVDGKTAMKDLDKNGNPIDRAYKDPKKLAKQLAEIDRQDKTTQLNRAAREAQATGKEFHFFGKMDKNGRSVGIEAYNPDKHRIEAGLVLNKNGDVLGNHIKIDETGIATGVGGTYHNVTDVFGEVDKWGNKYRITETLERNVMNNAPDKETGKKVVKWLIHSKNKNEAAMKTAARSMMQKNNARYKAVMSGKPITTRKATVMADSMAYGEGKLTKQDITAKYGENYGSTITSNMDEMRLDYDNYLDQINKVRKQYGQDVIPKRKDYITHVQELNSSQSFAGEVFGDLKNSIAGEGMETTRGAVPADIAGRTENFKPKSKWNPFLQQRTGSQNYVKNPFEAFDRYILPAEHNIHMTESVTRARVAEEVFRAAKNFDNLDKQNLGKLITDDLQKAAGDAVPDSLTKGFMEYANALAGKTNRLDRTVMDWSPATAKGVKGWQALQRTAGRATIPGNIKSIMMQPLSQVNVFSQVSIPSYTKGMAKWLKNDKIIELSPFIKARQTTVDSMFRNKLGKATDAASVPLQKVEMQSVKLAWYAQYEDALRKGLKGADAVAEADRLTERAVSGRGIGDKPELYRSTVTNGLLQYTLEVMGQSKMFWKDLTPAQKVKWMAGAAAINTMYAFVANDKPLPDYIDAAYESYKDFADPEDDRSGLEKVGGTAQRFAGETVKFNPIASKVAQSLPKNVKTSVFGSDSDVTRYDGAAAATRVLSNWWDAGVAVKDGDLVTARNKALKTMPVGNQAEKSLTGAEMLARGYDINDKGERTFDAPTGFVDKSRAVLFGPNATNAAKEYYANPQGYSSSQKKKTDAKFGIPTKMTLEESKVYTKKRIENAFGKEYADMNQDELKAIANTDSNAAEALQMYDSNKGAFGAGAKLPESLKSEPARKVLDRAYRTTTEDWGNQKNTIKEVNDSLKQWNNGKDLPEITNEVAKDWAEYQKDFAEGKISKMKADDKKKSILKKAYNSQLNEDEREIYKFSEADIKDGLSRGLLTEDNVKKALAVEKQLFDAKLITKESLAKKLDQPARGYKTSRSSGRSRSTGRRSSGGSRSSSSVFTPIPQSAYSMSGIYSQVSSKQKKLRDLLQAAKV